METMLLMLMATLGAAMIVAAGTFFVSHNRLVKARVLNAEFISLLLSLISFGTVISVVYLVLIGHIVSQW
ncbi:MAG: hypothetical protein JST32_10535 [Bacteroidetes bacterium]|nr:hypothetical protein [Bacteroidota bacterium]